MPAERYGKPTVLLGALLWRAKQEGFRYLLAGFLPCLVALCALIVPVLLGGGINGATTFADYGARYGAHADSIGIGEMLIEGPGLIALCSAIAVGLIVRNLVGSEASRGGIEALLAGPYRPGAIMTALLSYVAGLAIGYWAVMTTLTAAVLALIDHTSGANLSLTAGYLSLVLILPLLAAWSATSLSLLVNLLYPRLAQSGSIGLNMGGGGLATGAAILPALAVFLAFTIWTPHLAPGLLLAIAGSATAAIALASTVVVTYRFRPDAVLES